MLAAFAVVIGTSSASLAASTVSTSAASPSVSATPQAQGNAPHAVTIPSECQSASAFVDVAWQGPSCQAHGHLVVRLNSGRAITVAPADTIRALSATAAASASTAVAASTTGVCADPATHAHVELYYAHFAGQADNFGAHVSDLQNMFNLVDQNYIDYDSKSYGGPDMHLFVECAGDGNPAIHDIALSTTQGSTSFSTIVSDMQNQGHNSSLAHYWVWTDGNPTSGYAGQSSVIGDDSASANNAINSSNAYSVNYGYSAAGGGAGIFAHENGHAMGAVQLSAPDSTGAWHCTDGTDVMCYNDGGPAAGGYTSGDCPSAPNGTSILDCHRDNYFNPCPASGSYLSNHWDIASTYDAWVQISAAPSSIAFDQPSSTVIHGTPAVLDTLVTGAYCGGGTVTFTSGGTTLGTASVQSNGIASLPLGSFDVGTYTISASFGGSAWAAASSTSSPVTVSVIAAPYNTLDVMNEYGGAVPVPGSAVGTVPNQWGWPIARGIALDSSGSGGYVLDGWGGVHAFGTAPPVLETGYWPYWDIARGIVLRADGKSGYVLDGFGGIHPFGAAGDMPPSVSQTGYWAGWDIARAIVLRSDGVSGYVLDGWGGVFPFGGAPNVGITGYWPTWSIVRGIVLNPGTNSGYVLDGLGALHPFGGAPNVTITAYWSGWDIARAVVSVPNTPDEGWVLDGLGGLHPYGGAPLVGASSSGYWGADEARAIAAS
ncbi:MAG: Ig-like domain repeat protein [Candidatus Dormibacteraeota bacterium]|nr:Ig-like domain repeat protein [Candidatus Dormibacteraeota bacterium]